MPYGQLEVTVVEGKKLKDTDLFDKADPYVSLSLDRQNKQKTRAIQNAGSDATWNEKFTFDVLEGRNELFLEVLDEDVNKDDLIGEAVVPLFQVFQDGHAEQWVHITRSSGKPAGEIHLIIGFKKQGPTSGPPGHTPYPVPSLSGYFSPPNSSSSNKEFSSMGPEGGAIPSGYGSGAPPPIFSAMGPESGVIPSGYGSGAPPTIKPPYSTGPPAYPTAGGGFPDSSSYSMNMPGQAQAYYQQPTFGAPQSDYKPPSSEHTKEQKSSGDNDWIKTAGIAVAAAAGSGALGFLGGKLYGDQKHEHEKEDKDKHKKDKKDEYEDDEKHKDKKDKHKDKDEKHKDKKDKEKHKDKKDKEEKHKDKDKHKHKKDH